MSCFSDIAHASGYQTPGSGEAGAVERPFCAARAADP